MFFLVFSLSPVRSVQEQKQTDLCFPQSEREKESERLGKLVKRHTSPRYLTFFPSLLLIFFYFFFSWVSFWLVLGSDWRNAIGAGGAARCIWLGRGERAGRPGEIRGVLALPPCRPGTVPANAGTERARRGWWWGWVG